MTQHEIFLNDQVDIQSLPQLDNILYVPLQKSYMTLMVITVTIVSVVLILATWIGLMFSELPAWVSIAGILFWILLGLVRLLFIIKGFPHKAYAIRQRDIVYKTGWLYKRQTTIPFKRIQHVDVRQGLLERAFDLGKLNIYTAGGQGSDLSIPGLQFEEAQRIKAFILGIMISDEEE